MPLAPEIVPVTRIAERAGSGTLSFSKNGVTGNRTWVCPWFFSDGRSYLDFVQQLLGLTIPGPNFIPIINYPDSFSPELPFLYCQEVDVEGEDIFGTDGWGRIAYRRAIIKAKYIPYEMGESFHLAAQMFTCREGSFCWIGAPTPMPQRPANLVDDQATVMLAQVTQAIDKLNQVIQQNAVVNVDLFQPNVQPNLGQLPAALLDVLRQRRDKLVEQQRALNLRANAADAQQLARYLRDLEDWYLNQVAIFTNSGVPAGVFASTNAAANPVTVPVGKVIPLGEYTLEKHFVLQPNFGQWVAMMGCTNAYYFLGFSPWTLLFSGVDGKRTLLPNGTRCWDITLKFLFNPNGHNMLYRAEKGRWEVMVSLQTSKEGWLTAGLTNWAVVPQPIHRYLYEPIDYTPFLQYT